MLFKIYGPINKTSLKNTGVKVMDRFNNANFKSKRNGPIQNINIEALVVDSEIYRVFDQKYSVGVAYNAKGLYWNYFLHHWEGIATSRFANAIAFVSGNVDEKVTAIYANPQVAQIKKGGSVRVPFTVQTSGLNAPISLTATSGAPTKVSATLTDDLRHVTIKGLEAITAEGLTTVTVEDTNSNVKCEIKVVYNV